MFLDGRPIAGQKRTRPPSRLPPTHSRNTRRRPLRRRRLRRAPRTSTSRLRKLGELKSAGILTDEEFAAKKAQLLGL